MLSQNVIPFAPGEALSDLSQSESQIQDVLRTLNLLTNDQIRIAEREKARSGKKLEHILVSLGFITEKILKSITAKTVGLDHFDPKNIVPDPDVLKRIPKKIARHYKMAPLAMTHQVVFVAMSHSRDVLALDWLRRVFPGLEISPLVASSADILEILETHADREIVLHQSLKKMEDLKDLSSSSESPVIEFVRAVIMDAAHKGASDVHFQPEDSFVRIRYRVDGHLVPSVVFHKEHWSQVCTRLKILSDMNIAEQRLPQAGRFSFRIGLRELDCRVAAHPTAHGENIVLRILDKTHSLIPLDQLGFSEARTEALKSLLAQPNGMIIVTGPTGAGKTTTLYALLSYMNTEQQNIMTLEDPIEYQLPAIRQSDIRKMGGQSFAQGVRSLLRQDPDVIFIGEVRDEETAQMAWRAATTGHQVLTTLHTNDALGVVHRLNDLGLPRSAIAGNLTGVLAQRLLRKLCLACRAPRQTAVQETPTLSRLEKMYSPVGCSQCHNTGYKGRTVVSELLVPDEEFHEKLMAGENLSVLSAHLRAQNFCSLWEEGLSLLRQGITSLEELHLTLGIPSEGDPYANL